MSTSKSLKNQSAFFKQRMADAGKDIEASATDMQKSYLDYINRFKKDIVLVDIDRFEPALKEWNNFPQLAEDKMMQLMMSIMNNGIMNAVIAWDYTGEYKNGGKLMTLAGHNRLEASRRVIEVYGKDATKRNYREIPTIIFEKDEIDSTKAREIIIDTNYLQRSDLPPRIRVGVIRSRVSLMKEQTDERGAKIDELVSSLNLKKSTVYDDIKIGTKVIEPLQNLYFDEKINRRSVLKLAIFDENTQRWIYESFGPNLSNERIGRLSKRVKLREEIAAILGDEKEPAPSVVTQVTIPKDRLPEFRKLVAAYLSDPQFAGMCREYLESSGEEAGG